MLAPYAESSMDNEKNKPINPKGNQSEQASIFQDFQQDFEVFQTYNENQGLRIARSVGQGRGKKVQGKVANELA